MKFTTKKAGRMLSALLAAAIVTTSIPQTILTAYAAEIGDTNPPPPHTIVTDTDSDIPPDTPPNTDETPKMNATETSEEISPVVPGTSDEDSLADKERADNSQPSPFLEENNTADAEESNESTGEDDNTYISVQVTFEMSGHGDPVDPLEVTAGYTLEASKVPQPAAEGFRFDGWYKDEQLEQAWDFEKDIVPGENFSLYAKWTPLPNLHTVTFDLLGHGTPIDSLSVESGSKLETSESLQPVAEGFQFDGWYKNAELTELWDFNTDTVTSNITLYAKWTSLLTFFTVTFELSGHGNPIEAQKAAADSKLDKTTLQPSAEGYHFEGWYRDASFTDLWDFEKDTVTQDITLYAKWQEIAAGTHVVTFNLFGQGSDLFLYSTSGSKLERPADPQPSAEGYRFLGWYKDASYTTEWNFEQDIITTDITLYAKWEEIVYTVIFDFSGVGSNITKTDIKPGSLLTQTADLLPAAEGYLFLGWYKDASHTEAWDFAKDIVTNNITLYACWQKVYTVTFDLSGKGANIVKTNIYEGALLPKTEDLTPTAAGFHFENWYKDAEFTQVWDFDKDTVTDNITLYAKWEALKENQNIVTFHLSGHGANRYAYVDQGAKLTKPNDPVDEGWLFLDWYTDEEYRDTWDFNEPVEKNFTLYAKWAQLTSLQVNAITPQPFTGKAIKPSVSVYYSIYTEDGNETRTALKANKDYKISYVNNVNTNAYVQAQAGGSWEEGDTLFGGSNSNGLKTTGGFNPALPHVIIEGKGNYSGKLYMNFEITQISIGDGSETAATGITLKCNDQFPLGKPKKDQKTISSLKYKAALKEGTDYTAEITGAASNGSVISKEDPIFDKEGEGGDCTLTITGIGNYTGSIVRPIIVRANDTLLKNAKISLGSKCKSKPLNEDGVTLIPAYQETVEEEKTNADGDIIYDKNDEPVMVKKTYYYQYIDGDWTTDYWDYDEDTDKDVFRKLDRKNAFTVKVGNKWLKYGDDYEITYANNTSIGTATMTIKGTGEYTGSKSVNFKITKASGSSGGKAFNAKTVKVNGWTAKMPYTGLEQTQSEIALVSAKSHWVYDDEDDKAHSDKWKEYDHEFSEDEYTVTYTNNVRVGTATAIFTATPESGYSGSFKKTFKITSINMAEFVTFVGENETLEPIVIDEDIEVDTGKKDEDGEPIMKDKHIHQVKATRYMEGSIPYVKAGATLNFNLTSGISEEPLVLNRDYTISYKNNKSVTPWKTTKWRDKWQEEDENGKLYWEYGEWEYEENPVDSKMGALIITGKGNYSGKVTIKYVITQGTMDTEGAIVTVARSEYNPNTKEYKPKVTVWTPNAGTLSSKEFSVKYSNNKKTAVADYMNNGGEAPTATVTLKKNNSYTNLCDSEDTKYSDNPITLAPVTMEFYPNKLTSQNLYIIIDNENAKELVYTGKQVTNVKARVYYGNTAAVKAAKKAKITNNKMLTDTEGNYGLIRLTEAVSDGNGNYGEGEYTVTYGKNMAIGKNKGSITINGYGTYGGSVSQKFTIYQSPVYYHVVTVE